MNEEEKKIAELENAIKILKLKVKFNGQLRDKDRREDGILRHNVKEMITVDRARNEQRDTRIDKIENKLGEKEKEIKKHLEKREEKFDDRYAKKWIQSLVWAIIVPFILFVLAIVKELLAL